MITINDLNVGDKFTTYQASGVFKVLRIFKESVQCCNSDDIYTYNLNNNDIKKLNIKLT